MKFSIGLATIVSALAVMSAPIHLNDKREVGGILTCTGVNATGTCHYEVYKMNQCYELPKPYYQNINTFAPDGEHFACYPRVTGCKDICRSPTGCTFGAVDFNYEHKFNLGAIKWNTLFKSFDCALKKKPTSSAPPPTTATTATTTATATIEPICDKST